MRIRYFTLIRHQELKVYYDNTPSKRPWALAAQASKFGSGQLYRGGAWIIWFNYPCASAHPGYKVCHSFQTRLEASLMTEEAVSCKKENWPAASVSSLRSVCHMQYTNFGWGYRPVHANLCCLMSLRLNCNRSYVCELNWGNRLTQLHCGRSAVKIKFSLVEGVHVITLALLMYQYIDTITIVCVAASFFIYCEAICLIMTHS